MYTVQYSNSNDDADDDNNINNIKILYLCSVDNTYMVTMQHVQKQ